MYLLTIHSTFTNTKIHPSIFHACLLPSSGSRGSWWKQLADCEPLEEQKACLRCGTFFFFFKQTTTNKQQQKEKTWARRVCRRCVISGAPQVCRVQHFMLLCESSWSHPWVQAVLPMVFAVVSFHIGRISNARQSMNSFESDQIINKIKRGKCEQALRVFLKRH